MKLEAKQYTAIRWVARILSTLILLVGVFFYFGYGNPLPFANPDYTLAENIGLIIMPLVLIGLALGWKYEKVGGYLISIPLILGFIASLCAQVSFPTITLIALIPGILYIITGCKHNNEVIKKETPEIIS